MTTASLKKVIDAISAKIDENKDYLVQLDQQNGDGDLGISMSAGFHAAAEYLNGTQEQDLGRALNQCGNVFNEAAPSSLGTIAAFFFKGMARALRGQTDCTLQMVAAGMDAGVKNVMEKAGSKPGEKTILDSTVPGVKTLMAQAEQPDAWKKAAEAARAGSENTRTMRAVWGRAAYYGEKSIGILDGGSVVGALVFEAISEF